MKTISKKVLAIAVSLVISTTVFAEVKNYFVNGVGNDTDASDDSADYIRDISNIGVVKALYNTTEGAPKDFVEAWKMMEYVDGFYKSGKFNNDQKVSEILEKYYAEYDYNKFALNEAVDAYKRIKWNRVKGGSNLDEKVFVSELKKFVNIGNLYLQTKGFYDFLSKYGVSYRVLYLMYTENYDKLIYIFGEAEYIDSIKFQIVPDSLENKDINNMYDDLEVNNIDKYNFIAHSQGNLFANRLMALMAYNNIADSRMKLLSVATPDSYVYGGGKYVNLREDLVADTFTGLSKNNSDYKTNFKDSIWSKVDKEHGVVKKKTATASLNNFVYADFTGHGFVETYLHEGAGSKSFIVNEFRENYNSLNYITDPSNNIYLSSPNLSKSTIMQGELVIMNLKQIYSGNQRVSQLSNSQLCFRITTSKSWSNSAKVKNDVYAYSSIGSDDLSEREYVNLLVPASLAPGNYYFGMKANCNGAIAETDSSDNYQYVPITVISSSGNSGSSATEDYEVINFKLDDNRQSAKPGDRVYGSLKYCYNGNRSSTATTNVSYYFSSNRILDSNDVKLGFNSSTEDGIGLSRNHRCREITSDDDARGFNIPANTTTENLYYIIALPNDTSGTSTNSKYSGLSKNGLENVSIYISENGGNGTGGHDLGSKITISNAMLDDRNLELGESTTARATVNYSGGYTTRELGRTKIGYYLSKDRYWDRDTDIFLDYDNSSVGSNDLSDDEQESITIPSDLLLSSDSERWYILFVGDYQNDISADENDVKYVSVTISRKSSGSCSGSSSGSGGSNSGGSGSSSGGSTAQELNFVIDNLQRVKNNVSPGETIDLKFDYKYSGVVSNPAYTVVKYFFTKEPYADLGYKQFLGHDTGRNNGLLLSPENSVRKIERKIVIPKPIESGQWYLVIVPDADFANNEVNVDGSSGENDNEIIPIMVVSENRNENNYYVENMVVDDSVEVGAAVDISLDYSYSENAILNPVSTVIHYFLSRTPNRSGTFKFLGWDNSKGNNGNFLTNTNRNIHINRKLVIPSDVVPGNYYIIAVSDATNAVDEGSGEDDFQSVPVEIYPANGQNFYIYNLRGVPENVDAGSDISLSFDYRYSGGVQNPVYTTVKYFLSKSSTELVDEIFLGWDSGNNNGTKLSVLNSFRRFENRMIKIHSWIESGDYFLHIVPDADGAVSEGINENDNVVALLHIN